MAVLPHFFERSRSPMFFTRDKSFYRSFFHLFIVVVLQNVVAYSVNMADNLMLGSYSQAALSGAATVNQIQFLVQQATGWSSSTPSTGESATSPPSGP